MVTVTGTRFPSPSCEIPRHGCCRTARSTRRIAAAKPSPCPRHSGERWQTILKGAAEVFLREGFARARLEDVAVEVGINRASLYYYVGTKEELLVALIEQPAYTMTRHCREALESDAPADEKLRRALRAYVEDLAASPEVFLLFSESQHLATIPEARDIVTNADAYGKTLLAIVEEGVASGVFRQDLDPRLVMPGPGGARQRLTAERLQAMDDADLAAVVQAVLRPGAINLQRYAGGRGGYPYWHCELYPRDAQAETLHRHLLWTLYLNDGFGDGETEFLYQRRKIAPRTGTLLIAPAAFTHTHRGNRPEGGDKYIATSWILFQRAEQIFGSGEGRR